MPTGLQKPDVTDGDPRALYHHNLVHGESANWYSERASPTELYEYVLELLQIAPSQFRHTLEGLVRSIDESLMLIAARSPRGTVCSVWGFGSDGAARVNAAIQREWDRMMEEMGLGQYTGNKASARWAPIVDGKIREDFAGSELFDFINGCDVIPMGEPDAAPSNDSGPDPFDDSKVLKYLEADSDVVDIEVVHDRMFKAQVTLNGQEGMPAVPLIVSTGLNDQMLIILGLVDSQQLAAALAATSDIGVVGLASVGDNHALRYGVFKEHSDMMALVNGLQAVALAYCKYLVAQD